MKSFLRQHAAAVAFGAAFVLALVFACYTQHVWEDYYITYRSSRNLAKGYGLVFNHGEHLHTFTSPLGVLLPALALLLTGNFSDTAALWLFRVMSAAAFGGSVALLVQLGRRSALAGFGIFVLAALLCCDAKALDFTINGMETAFMLLFLAYSLWALGQGGTRQWRHLGVAWAGLMWTRPDSFIYIALVAGAAWIFNRPESTGANRAGLLRSYLKAGLLTVALYGLWLVFAWWYYGTAVPHTITAKAAQGAGLAWPNFVHGFWRLPYLILRGQTSAEAAFLPAYYTFPEWPAWMVAYGRVLAAIASILWLVPKVRFEVRVTSFAFYGGACYLSFVPYFPFPWYFPTITLLAFVALAGTVGQLWAAWGRTRIRIPGRFALVAGVAGCLVANVWLTIAVAGQVRAQQEYVENRTRRAVGEWLRGHAARTDTVFMEPLGYIGFFSRLKTYDWPGLSSRDLVNAGWLVGRDWTDLICYLQPTWVVLRIEGDREIGTVLPSLTGNYERAAEFDQREAIGKLQIHGRRLLEFDSHFIVYHLIRPTRYDADGAEIASPIGSSVRAIDHVNVRLVHAPGSMILPVPAEARTVEGRFGYPPEAFAGDPHTDGGRFVVYWFDGRRRTPLFDRILRPATVPGDRGLQSYRIELPAAPHGPGCRLVFATETLETMTMDWTCWSPPEFR
ncbi:MAG TPA: hypothetical protein VGM73_17895 [Candidatus Didemnitutus sp.]